MSVRTLLAAILVISVPIAVNGAEPQTGQQKVNPQAKRVCTMHPEAGSRINTVRVCRTAVEDEESRQERRRVIDRIQANKVSFGH
jgi:hypothetical protein